MLFFSLLRSQDPKNTVAVLPALAVLTAVGLAQLRPGIWKSILGVAVVGASLFQVWVGTFGTRLVPPYVVLSLGYRLPGILLYRQALDDLQESFHLLPRTETWPLAEIVQRVGQMSRTQPDRAPRLAVVPSHSYFNGVNIRNFAVLNGLSTLDVFQVGQPPRADMDALGELMTAGYAVVKTGYPGVAQFNVHNRELMEFLASPTSPFAEAGPRLPVPDGSQAIIYGRRDEASQALTPLLSYQISEPWHGRARTP